MVDTTIPNPITKPTVTKRTPKAPAPKVPAAPPPAPAEVEALQYQGFELELEHDVALPVNVTRTNNLPFKEWFSQMKHGSHIFLPTTFWTQGMHKAPETATHAYARQRIRDQFNIWKKADPQARANHNILLHNRAEGSTDHTGRVYHEGVSIYMEVTTPK